MDCLPRLFSVIKVDRFVRKYLVGFVAFTRNDHQVAIFGGLNCPPDRLSSIRLLFHHIGECWGDSCQDFANDRVRILRTRVIRGNNHVI